MKTNLKLHLEIDRDLLVPYNRVAGILGISPFHYIQSYLAALLNDLGSNPVLHIANELFYESYRSQKLAEAAAERFEAFAIEQQLDGKSVASTISTAVPAV